MSTRVRNPHPHPVHLATRPPQSLDKGDELELDADVAADLIRTGAVEEVAAKPTKKTAAKRGKSNSTEGADE